MIVHYENKLIKLAKQKSLREIASPTILVCDGVETADKTLWLNEGENSERLGS